MLCRSHIYIHNCHHVYRTRRRLCALARSQRASLPQVDNRIRFRHPGYESPFNKLFALWRVERVQVDGREQWGDSMSDRRQQRVRWLSCRDSRWPTHRRRCRLRPPPIRLLFRRSRQAYLRRYPVVPRMEVSRHLATSMDGGWDKFRCSSIRCSSQFTEYSFRLSYSRFTVYD